MVFIFNENIIIRPRAYRHNIKIKYNNINTTTNKTHVTWACIVCTYITYYVDKTKRAPGRRSWRWRRRWGLGIAQRFECFLVEFSRGHCVGGATTRRHPADCITGVYKPDYLSTWPRKIQKLYFFFHPYTGTCLPVYVPTCLPTCLPTHLCLFLSDAECENRERRTLSQTGLRCTNPPPPHAHTHLRGQDVRALLLLSLLFRAHKRGQRVGAGAD